MKNIKILIFLFVTAIYLSNINFSYASYSVLCDTGKINIDFSSSGEDYERVYDVNELGKIEINGIINSSNNISNDGCANTTSTCNIDSSIDKDRVYIGSKTEETISIQTNGIIKKGASNDIIINAEANSGVTVRINGFSVEYNFTGKVISLFIDKSGYIILKELRKSNNKKTLIKQLEKIYFDNPAVYAFPSVSSTTKDVYSEFYFSGDLFSLESLGEITTGNATLTLKRNLFENNATGTKPSFEGGSKSYYPSSGDNSPDGLDYIDYENMLGDIEKTSVELTLHPINLNCSIVEDYPESSISYTTARITSEIDEESSGTTTQNAEFNTSSLKINDGGFDYANRMIVFATGGQYKIEGLKYTTVKIIGGVKLGVNKIIMSLENNNGDIIGDHSHDFPNGITDLNIEEFSESITNISLDPVTHIAGDYKFKFEFYNAILSADGTSFEYQLLGEEKIDLTIIPTNDIMFENDAGVIDYSTNSSVFPLANWEQYANICYKVTDNFGNQIDHDYQSINGIKFNGSNSTYNPKEDSEATLLSYGIYNNQKNNNGGEAININDSASEGYVEFKNSEVCFNVKSRAPGKNKLIFKIKVPKHNRDYDITPVKSTDNLSDYIYQYNNTNKKYKSTNTAIQFDKPFIGNLDIFNDDYFKVGTEQTIKMKIEKDPACSECSDNYEINSFSGTFDSTDTTEYKIIRINNERELNGNVVASGNPYINSSSQPKLDFVLNYIGNTSIDQTYGVISEPYIINEVDGEEVQYRLSMNKTGGGTDPLISLAEKFYGIKVIGLLQGQGKQTISGQDENISSLDKIKYRRSIKENAQEYIKVLNSGDILNKVKFIDGDVDGDFIINGNGTPGDGDNSDYETLIIKNGNLIISGTGEVIRDNLGIIVLKDDLGDKDKGNLYITPNVTDIKAMIYLDGGLISVPNETSTYLKDSPERTRELQKQLRLKGSLFSRNTIGGSIGNGTNFKLPGGETTTDFDEAVKYDLNYVRRGIDGWDLNNSGEIPDLGEFDNVGFILKYNSENQYNPPKLFNIINFNYFSY